MVRRNYRRKKITKVKSSLSSGNPINRKKYVKRRPEVYGILIIMVSVLLFISVFGFSNAGFLNTYVNDFLSFVFGVGRYLIPFLLLIWGFSFFLKRLRLLPSSFGWGFFLLFFSILGIRSHNFALKVNIFDKVLVENRGGIVGAGIFYGLYKLFSSAGAVVVLGVLMIISILIITKISLIDIGKKII
jgi:S-DNA-T family DNA segregation ATPase FtsK/SpoIIIE